ncbi:hypothetical protein HT102_13090 [Hoyosella sp. G463]|uniref:Uncharacterized protein n=1 Tax=Lolliginicoccus lacisalsi TaxID=2742202 RepID=A0A927JE43_9ACTN|nr:hypothetical protein [Lolliginicoccus lacisalsi]MBD8507418.1 hypothetical protein [Lolliginicoccus lacisalsi]
MTSRTALCLLAIHAVAGLVGGIAMRVSGLGGWVSAIVLGVAIGLGAGTFATVGATLAHRRESRRPSPTGFAWRRRYTAAVAATVLLGTGLALFALAVARAGSVASITLVELMVLATVTLAFSLISAAISQACLPSRHGSGGKEHDPLF